MGDENMSEWLEQVEPLTLKGQIRMPYAWWAGEVGSRFLLGLRDEKTFWGTRCPECRLWQCNREAGSLAPFAIASGAAARRHTAIVIRA